MTATIAIAERPAATVSRLERAKDCVLVILGALADYERPDTYTSDMGRTQAYECVPCAKSLDLCPDHAGAANAVKRLEKAMDEVRAAQTAEELLAAIEAAEYGGKR